MKRRPMPISVYQTSMPRSDFPGAATPLTIGAKTETPLNYAVRSQGKEKVAAV